MYKFIFWQHLNRHIRCQFILHNINVKGNTNTITYSFLFCLLIDEEEIGDAENIWHNPGTYHLCNYVAIYLGQTTFMTNSVDLTRIKIGNCLICFQISVERNLSFDCKSIHLSVNLWTILIRLPESLRFVLRQHLLLEKYWANLNMIWYVSTVG